MMERNAFHQMPLALKEEIESKRLPNVFFDDYACIKAVAAQFKSETSSDDCSADSINQRRALARRMLTIFSIGIDNMANGRDKQFLGAVMARTLEAITSASNTPLIQR